MARLFNPVRRGIRRRNGQTLFHAFMCRVAFVSGSDCWYWHGTTNRHGYGTFGRSPMWLAHRLSWHLHNGPIPPDIDVLHRCDVTGCVNPGHLFLGTALDNVRDMIAKGRKRVGGPARGAGHFNAKLTQEKADAIRAAYAAGGRSLNCVAMNFGVSQGTVHAIVRGRRWLSGGPSADSE
jgi:hypothetical protein